MYNTLIRVCLHKSSLCSGSITITPQVLISCCPALVLWSLSSFRRVLHINPWIPSSKIICRQKQASIELTWAVLKLETIEKCSLWVIIFFFANIISVQRVSCCCCFDILWGPSHSFFPSSSSPLFLSHPSSVARVSTQTDEEPELIVMLQTQVLVSNNIPLSRVTSTYLVSPYRYPCDTSFITPSDAFTWHERTSPLRQYKL